MRKKIKLGLVIGFCLFGLMGCGEESILTTVIKGEEVTRIDSDKLASFRGSLVGDNSAICGIINALPGNIYFDKVELQTEKEPYGINVKYSKKEIKEEQIKDFLDGSKSIMDRNAREMFILVNNLGEIIFDLTDLGGAKIKFRRDEFLKLGCDGLKVLEVEPYKSGGKFELGMSKEEVAKVADEYRSRGIEEIQLEGVFSKEGNGTLVQNFEAIHCYYDKDEKLEFIEFTGEIALSLEGKLFKNNFQENVKAIKEIDRDVFVDNNCFISKKYGIAGQNHENSPIGIFKEGYYQPKCGNG